MSEKKPKGTGGNGTERRRFAHLTAFPLIMALIYSVVALVNPEQAITAMKVSGKVLLQTAPALIVTFGILVLLNMLVTPAHIKRFFGKGMKAKGIILSSAAGILSMGSIYAWYPLLKGFREKGVSDFHLANFLGCRAVKIPLLPMMAAYFGWAFTLILTILMIFSALLTGFGLSTFESHRKA